MQTQSRERAIEELRRRHAAEEAQKRRSEEAEVQRRVEQEKCVAAAEARKQEVAKLVPVSTIFTIILCMIFIILINHVLIITFLLITRVSDSDWLLLRDFGAH